MPSPPISPIKGNVAGKSLGKSTSPSSIQFKGSKTSLLSNRSSSGVAVVSPGATDGARLWSTTETEELSTAESGLVGFLRAAEAVVSAIEAVWGRGMEWRHTFKIATPVGLEFFPPSPDRVVD